MTKVQASGVDPESNAITENLAISSQKTGPPNAMNWETISPIRIGLRVVELVSKLILLEWVSQMSAMDFTPKESLPVFGYPTKAPARYGKSILQTHSCFQKQLHLRLDYFILKKKKKGGALWLETTEN